MAECGERVRTAWHVCTSGLQSPVVYMYTRLQGTMVGSARARGAITLYVLMCCEVLVKCSFLGGGGRECTTSS